MITRPLPRTPNMALRHARQSMRLSQAQLADAIRAAGNAIGAPNRCTKRLVQKWETGEHAACRPDYLRVLQAVTGLSARELGFRIMPDESGLSTAIDSTIAIGTDGGSTGATARFAMSGLTEYSADGVIEGSMDRLRRALNHPAIVDVQTAELVQNATSRLYDLERFSPARLLAPTVDQHLDRATALLVAARPERVRRTLTVAAGRSALLAGWLAFDRSDLTSAHRLWDNAIAAAEGTVDNALFAAAFTYESYAAMRRGDPESAWRLAHTAAAKTPDDPRATAWATSRVAVYAARLCENKAAEGAMKSCLDLGGELAPAQPGTDTPWMRFFDRAALLSSVAHAAAVLGAPRAADYAEQAVDALGPAKVKSRAVVLAEAALTAAIVGDLGSCVEWGGEAATLARELNVSVAIDLLYEVLPIVLPYSDTRAVRELLPRLTRLTRTTDLQDEADPDGEEDGPKDR